MHNKNSIIKEKNIDEVKSWDNSTIKVIALACMIMVLSVILIGTASYIIAEKAVVSKLKSQDLVYISLSIASKIDSEIGRAKETSLILANDPVISDWVQEAEKDDVLKGYALKKISDIASGYGYDNSFIVSAVTGNYWAEGGELIDVMDINDSDDSWFFDIITSENPLTIVIDYNNERGDTFVFVNALVGNVKKPSAVTGVGFNLKDISDEFEGYKFGKESNMWLVDSNGDIYISEDIEHLSRNIRDFLPESIGETIIRNIEKDNIDSKVLEYRSRGGVVYDLIYQSIESTDWKLVFQIPRKESISIVNSIKINTVAAAIITMILIVVIFLIISRKIADPYKRAVIISRELEKKVDERTRELNEKNESIMDSIEYAKLLQESILPLEEELDAVFDGYFVIWKPRDIVGGDFYSFYKTGSGYLLIVGDCTGHGVPGAFMTMAANSMLRHIIDEICDNDPARILMELNRLLKNTLKSKSRRREITDDGLSAGIICISTDGTVLYAGADISLYVKGRMGIEAVEGERTGIGYRSTDDAYRYTNKRIMPEPGQTFYITTDGYTDQNGGEKGFAYGKKRFLSLIENVSEKPISMQGQAFKQDLKSYMGERGQRDDITVIGFKLK